jgi:hypothetical protein
MDESMNQKQLNSLLITKKYMPDLYKDVAVSGKTASTQDTNQRMSEALHAIVKA